VALPAAAAAAFVRDMEAANETAWIVGKVVARSPQCAQNRATLSESLQWIEV
jgi:hypothetical protein